MAKLRININFMAKYRLKEIEAQRDRELTERFEQEESALSITPRTFTERVLQPAVVQKVSGKLHQFYELTAQQLQSSRQKFMEVMESFRVFEEQGNIENAEFKSLQHTVQRDNPHKMLEVMSAQVAKLRLYTSFCESISPAADASFGELLFFVDVYTGNEGVGVTRYGIQTTEALRLREFNEVVAGTKAMSATPSITSSRSGRSGSKASEKKQEDVHKLLHPIEVYLIQETLNNTEDGPVLVDIFARNDDGTIRMGSQETAPMAAAAEEAKESPTTPETHTIVLYKQAGKVIIIDPNNSDFSNHIALGINKVLVLQNCEQDYEIVVPKHKLQIYTPKEGTVGPNPEQFRDCIDIAVKLAFAIQKAPPLEDIADLMLWKPVVEITNDPKIDRNLTNIVEMHPVRIRQSSNDQIRDKFNAVNQGIKKLFEILVNLKGSTNAEVVLLREKYDEEITKQVGSDNYEQLLFGTEEDSSSLLTMYDETHDALHQTLQGQQTDLHLPLNE